MNRYMAFCGCCLFAGAAFAGPAKSTQKVQLSQIIVEAPRLPVLGLSGHSPLKVLTSTDLRNLGVHTLGQAMRLMPIFGSAAGLGTGTTDKFTNGGEQNADLFDLTKSRVLILVNGQRWIQGFEGDTDLSTFPVSLIKRIEVYPARGAVAYGNGAISGVVNIVTVNAFNGGRLSAGTGTSQGDGHWDGQRNWASLALGQRDSSSGLMADLSWSRQNAISAADRSLTSNPLPGTGVTRESPITPYGQFKFVPTSGPYANSSDCPVQPDGSRLCNLTSDTSAASGYRPITSNDVYNTYPHNNLIMPMEQWGLYVSGFRDFGNGIKAHASIFGGRRTASQIGPPTTLTLGTTGIPVSVSANQPYNPFGVALNSTGPNANLIALSRRMTELGPVVFNDTSDTYRATFSLDGSINRQAQSPWNWHLSYLWASSQVDNTNQGRVNLNHLALALGDPSVCASMPACTPLDIFGGPGSVTPAMKAFITLPEHNRIANKMQIWSATLSQNDLATLPAGPVALGFGYRHFARDGVFVPDPAASQGIDSAVPLLHLPSYGGGYNGNALWGQSVVPLIGGTHALTLGAGFRLFNYSDTGSGHIGEATLNFDATQELSFQAGWTQGFRTPNLRELGQAIPGTAETVTDPCSNYTATGVNPVIAAACAAAGVPTNYVQTNPQAQILKVGNPNLQPERSQNNWISAKWEPKSVPGLSVNLAYYRITINNAVNRLSAGQTLLDCYKFGNPLSCSGIYRAPDGQLTVISRQTINGQSVRTDWLTGGAQYDRFTPIGEFLLRSDLAWTRRYTVTTATANGGKVDEQAGTELGPGEPSGIPRWSGTASLNWSYGSLSAGWQLRAIGPMNEACSDQYDGTSSSYTALGLCSQPNAGNPSLSRNHLGTTLYHDMYVGYQFSHSLTVTAGVNNIFAKEPPISISQPLHYDPAIYPVPGRTFYASLHYSWG